MSNNNLNLIEYSFIYIDKSIRYAENKENNIAVSEKVFTEIKNFVLRNAYEQDSSIDSILVPGYVKGYGEVLKAKNYVGVIQTHNGTTIEILPKIHGITGSGLDIRNQTKKIFLKMLKTLKNSPFKMLKPAHLNRAKLPLFDVFISMFLDELEILIKRGLRKDYLVISENLHKLKGKLNFPENIQKNLVHKERFYVEYDEFSINRPENRLIKSTLIFLRNKAKSNLIQQRLRKNSYVFEDVCESENIDSDFSKCKTNRLTIHLGKLLQWCRIFLKNQSFSNFRGNEIAFALLFPMERIFEDYVASKLKKHHKIKTQCVHGHLLINPGRHLMKPDIIFVKKPVIADTKWKILDRDHKMFQSDLYQMLAYGVHPLRERKNIEKIIMIFPKTEYFLESNKYTYFNGLELEVFPFDLTDDEQNRDLY